MLVIRVEMWPGGNPRFIQTVYTAVVENVSELAPDSEYVARDDQGRVVRLAHKRVDGAAVLARKAMVALARKKGPLGAGE